MEDMGVALLGQIKYLYTQIKCKTSCPICNDIREKIQEAEQKYDLLKPFKFKTKGFTSEKVLF